MQQADARAAAKTHGSHLQQSRIVPSPPYYVQDGTHSIKPFRRLAVAPTYQSPREG